MRFNVFLFFGTLAALPAFASSTAMQKQLKIESLLKTQNGIETSFSKALARENYYAGLGLTMQQKVQREFKDVTSKIQKQIIAAYKAELLLNENDSEGAKETVLKFINRDLGPVDKDVANDIQALTSEVLKTIDSSLSESEIMSDDLELPALEASIASEVMDRELVMKNVTCCENFTPQSTTSKDAHKKSYKDIPELIESLVSDRENAKYVSTSNQTLVTAQATRKEANIDVSVKIPFLGVTGELGTKISFNREISTGATIMAEGLHPALYADGNFDHFKRKKDGSVLKINGVEQKRFITFSCDADMSFSNATTLGGGLSIGVPGVSAGGAKNWTKTYSSSVNMTSRRLVLPESINNKTVTVKSLTQICQTYFLKAKFNDVMTVEKSLELMMRNVISGLEFSHSKTKCAQDEQCYTWFNHQVIGLAKLNNWPRCEAESQGYLSCKVKGLTGQNCPVIEKGKRISNGEFEFSCDKGLKCAKISDAVYSSNSIEEFLYGKIKTPAKGKCRPVNSSTYRDPAGSQDDRDVRYIPINFE